MSWIGPASLALNTLPLLQIAVERYQKDKLKEKTEREFFQAMENEINSYINTFEKINIISNEKFFPLLENMIKEFNLKHLEELLVINYELYSNFDKIVDYIIKIAEGCRRLRKFEDFMNNSAYTNPILYRFIITMDGSLKRKGRIYFDEDFLFFFKMHKDEIFKDVDEKEIVEASSKVNKYLEVINKNFIPSEKFYQSNRRLQQLFNEILNIIKRINKKTHAPKHVVKDIRKYVPKKLLPLIIVLEEVTEKIEKRKQRYKKKKIKGS